LIKYHSLISLDQFHFRLPRLS